MQFEKCLTCPAIKAKQCCGPNYMAMSAKELVAWGMEYQRLHGITNAQLAKHSGIPKGTIDGIKYRVDIRHDTICPLIESLIEMTGGVWSGESCSVYNEIDSHLAAENKRLQQDLEQCRSQLAIQERELERCMSDVKMRNILVFALLGLSVILSLLTPLLVHLFTK